MKWAVQKLEEIVSIKTGKLDSNAAVSNGQYPFFTCDPQTLAINTYAYDTEAVLLAGNNASGNYTAKYYHGKFNAYQRTYIIESIDKGKLDIHCFLYALNEQLALLKSIFSGSTTKFLTMSMLKPLSVPCPTISVQHRIASILSAYDDLIENNRRQIKLLEEAAQRLYREWFVELRFPGHESVKVVDGVPEGWMKGTLNTIAEFTGKKANKAERERYKCYLPIDCLPKKSLAYINHDNISNAESSLLSFAKYDIIFGAMRPYFHKVVIAQEEGLTRSTCFVINSRSKEYWSYVCMLLFSEEAIDYATHVSVGTTMPYVDGKILNACLF